jgi:anthranilate phosphoribosyltransferase
MIVATTFHQRETAPPLDQTIDLPLQAAPRARMAGYVQALGRGPGRARSLTREETRDAFALMLAGDADPHQIGALLLLLRYRGEAVPEMTGVVEAIRAHAGLDAGAAHGADLDWPSYGSGKTRGAPWFLLAALALAANGVRVVMHGSNEFSRGISVADALAALGLPAARDLAEARGHIAAANFAYLPLAAISPGADMLLNLRALLGLRTPVNTAGRLLDPLNALAAIDGVFHPPYIDLHLGVAAALARPRLLVIKGAGGEAERNPLKPLTAHVWDRRTGRGEIALSACAPGVDLAVTKSLGVGDFVALWRGESDDAGARATILGTMAAALLALDRAPEVEAAERLAREFWQNRHAL